MKLPQLPKIPFISIPDTAILSTTQKHLPITDITNDIVIYKNGGAALVMESTSRAFVRKGTSGCNRRLCGFN